MSTGITLIGGPSASADFPATAHDRPRANTMQSQLNRRIRYKTSLPGRRHHPRVVSA
jgi:hypothetical protein